MIYELREIQVAPGVSKLPAEHEGIEKIVLPGFQKGGAKVIGCWSNTAGSGPSRLAILLQWESLEQRTKAFAATAADPAYQRAMAESEKDGPLTVGANISFLQPTRYSLMQ